MLNMCLYKKLPYEIKCIIYLSVKLHYDKRTNKQRLELLNVINNVYSKLKEVSQKNDIINILEPDSYMKLSNTLEDKPLSIYQAFFNIRQFEEEFKQQKEYEYSSEGLKISYDSEYIRDKYSDTLYIYFIDDKNNLIKLDVALLYGTYVRIPSDFLKSTNLMFLISDVNMNESDEILQSNISELIYDKHFKYDEITERPIFKFCMNELLNNDFKFTEHLQKGSHENLIYKSIFERKFLKNYF